MDVRNAGKQIVYVLDSFPSLSETFILNEMLEVQRRGHRLKVFAFLKGNVARAHSGVEAIKDVTYFEHQNVWTKLAAHYYWLRKAPFRYLKAGWLALDPRNYVTKMFLGGLHEVRLLQQSMPDHVHAHFGHGTSNLAMLTHVLTKISYTFTTHRYDLFELPARNYSMKSRLAKKHITVSAFNKGYITAQLGVDENDVEVVHCGVDLESFASCQHEPTGSVSSIVSVARLDRQKGLDILIKACAELKLKGMAFQCQIVGEGPERSSLQALLDELGLSKSILLLGGMTQEEVRRILSKATMVVLPSRSEGIPVALMEAMAMKVPVISTKITGIPELIEDNVSGFMVPPENVAALAQRMHALLTDSEMRMRFAENGYKTIRRDFNLRTQVTRLLEIWFGKGQQRPEYQETESTTRLPVGV